MKKLYLFLILSVGLIGLGSAILLPYIQSLFIGSVDVDSPLRLVSSSDGVSYSTTPLTFNNMVGGDEITYWVVGVYNGNSEINSIFITEISNDNDNAMCEDFESLKVVSRTGLNGYPNGEEIDISNLCANNNGRIEIVIPATFTQDIRSQEYQFKGKFAVNVNPSEYSITTKL